MKLPTFSIEDADVTLQRKVNDMMDWGILLSVVALTSVGLISIYSATYDAGSSIYFNRQVTYALVGLTTAVIAYFLPERFLRSMAYPAYAVGIIMLILVLVPGIGLKVHGQQCWINVAGFTFQPSEFAKLSTLMALGQYMSLRGADPKTLRTLAWLAILVLVPMGLILLQPDTGSATVFAVILIGVLLWTGADLFLLYVVSVTPIVAISALYGTLFEVDWLFYIALIAVTTGAIIFRRRIVATTMAIIVLVSVGFAVEPAFDRLEPYQQNRLITLFEPERNPRGEGYHVIQSILAVGSGGVTGKGYMQGTQTQLRYIPEQWTDFIFCVPTEEFGFIGGSVVLLLFGILLWRSVVIASVVRTRFAAVITIGFATIIFYHTLVNVGMAIGVFPVMGIPLPFLSAGGTALIVYLTTAGLILNFYRIRLRSI